jgi:hypothetical protein
MIRKSLRPLIRGLLVTYALTKSVDAAAECGPNLKCLVALGNSITLHGPTPSIGWTGDWGMAATDPSRDYVAQLTSLLSKGSAWGAERLSLSALEINPEDFHMAESSIQLASHADVVIVQVGDNFKLGTDNGAAFAKAYSETLSSVRPHKGVLACVSTWWASEAKDKIIRERCSAVGGRFVDISQLHTNPSSVAGFDRHFADPGVAAHPGDRGMKAIADQIAKSIRSE